MTSGFSSKQLKTWARKLKLGWGWVFQHGNDLKSKAVCVFYCIKWIRWLKCDWSLCFSSQAECCSRQLHDVSCTQALWGRTVSLCEDRFCEHTPQNVQSKHFIVKLSFHLPQKPVGIWNEQSYVKHTHTASSVFHPVVVELFSARFTLGKILKSYLWGRKFTFLLIFADKHFLNL